MTLLTKRVLKFVNTKRDGRKNIKRANECKKFDHIRINCPREKHLRKPKSFMGCKALI